MLPKRKGRLQAAFAVFFGLSLRNLSVADHPLVHRSNARLAQDLQVLLRHKPEIVITSVGSPAPVLAALHDVGALVFADVASIRHAERAIAAGADGLVLLTAGRRRSDRLAQPVRVRPRGAGVVRRTDRAGGRHRRRPCAACGAGARLRSRLYGHQVHRHPPRAWPTPRYKEMLVASSADDILLTTAFTGLQTNMLRPSITAAGLDPDDLPQRGAIDIGKDIDIGAREARPARWRDIWSAGHSTSGVTEVLPVDDLVARTAAEYRAADAPTCSQLRP